MVFFQMQFTLLDYRAVSIVYLPYRSKIEENLFMFYWIIMISDSVSKFSYRYSFIWPHMQIYYYLLNTSQPRETFLTASNSYSGRVLAIIYFYYSFIYFTLFHLFGILDVWKSESFVPTLPFLRTELRRSVRGIINELLVYKPMYPYASK